ncbi:hypothetical protein [Microbulbifer yueqingensis]|uniref:DUF1573 domain-containing protein n=1 Tax=Microbulbifer yueqingensis TaxID=658219 RepID=A0A1G9BDD1_9GAMM|nr:hypothetical protein [Microbulbifer yueqingensis]SDK37084.1 hypothetical protein SAMN05216212_2189 [Microbulbifer yueqingensis]
MLMKPAMKIFAVFGVALLTLAGDIAAVQAEPTELVVRARAKDAKFIGTSIGGARVIVREAASGRILAEGMTSGSTGNTEVIMKQPHRRHQPIAEGAAAFRTSLELDEPKLVTVEVLAPYIKRQARVLATTQTWLVPGKDIDGDGLVIEIPGMVVDVLSPQTHRYASLSEGPFEIRANVVMMCGCPVTDGGLWDGSKMEVAAVVKKDGEDFKTIPLKLTDDNTFSASLEPTQPGVYELLVYAFDDRTGNTGVDQVSFIVRK